MTVTLPNVVYIGLQKTGSTFLRNYFYSHSSIRCTRHGLFFQTDQADTAIQPAARAREIYAQRFSTEPDRPCRIDMYESLGMGYALCGTADWDPSIMVQPGLAASDPRVTFSPDQIADRIAAILPGAKVILTVRNQIDWLDSNFRWFLPHLKAGCATLMDFLSTREGKLALAAGHYDRLYDIYAERFGSDNLLIMPLERLQAAEEDCLRQVCAFLEVPFLPYNDNDKKYNRGPDLPPQAQVQTSRWWRRRKPQATMRPAEIDVLRLVFAESNARLSRLLGLDLAALGYAV